MRTANTNMDYNNCVANCKSLFPNSEAALVACINGCAKVNAPAEYATLDEASQVQAEVQKLGRQEFFRKVKAAAKKALSQLPEDGKVAELDAVSRRYVERISVLIEAGLKLSDADDAAIASFAQEVAWAKLSSDISAAALARMAGGGSSTGSTCVTRCAEEYQNCIGENGCDTSGWVCVCCVPCSLQYMGCVAKCVTVGGGFGSGGAIA